MLDLSNTIGNYDIAPDGKRAAALIGVEDNEAPRRNHLIFLENFADELQRKMPLRGK